MPPRFLIPLRCAQRVSQSVTGSIANSRPSAHWSTQSVRLYRQMSAAAARMDSSESTLQQPWDVEDPHGRSEPMSISGADVLRLLKSDTAQEKDFVLVDLRREDFEGGTIKSAINIPAQSVTPTAPSLYRLFNTAGKRRIIWYCGSSLHRGKWAASYFNDYIAAQDNTVMQSLVLTGGIKGWVAGKGEFVEYMHEYNESKW